MIVAFVFGFRHSKKYFLFEGPEMSLNSTIITDTLFSLSASRRDLPEDIVKSRDFFTKIIVLRVLSRWTGDYCHDGVLSEVIDRGLFPRENIPDDTALLVKWDQEIAKQKSEDKYIYVIPRKILNEEDVHEYATLCRRIFDIPEQVPDHANIEFLSDLLDINSVERTALNLALYLNSPYNTNTGNYVWNKIMNMDSVKKLDSAYEIFAGLSPTEVKELHHGTLRRSAILTVPSSGVYGLNDDLQSIFCRENVSSKYIEDTLFPSSIATQLNVSDYPHVSKETTRVMDIVDRTLASRRIGNNIMLWGGPGTGKTELTLAMAKERGWNLRVIGDMSADDSNEKSRNARIASLKLAQKILANDKNAVLLFDEMEDLFKTDTNASFSKAYINRIIETSPIPIIWTTNSLMALEHSVLRRMVYNINLENPPVETREIIWKKYCREIGLKLSTPAIKKLAAAYEIAPALIRNAVSVAYAVVGEAKGKRAEMEIHEIVESLDKLVNMGKERAPIEMESDTPYDLTCVNSDTNVSAFTDDIAAAAPRWAMCLYGAPGTGKSEYGRYIAKRLGKKLVLKRASDLVSMWVGQTEQNIAKAFEEARRNKHILLIDEGDSFLRSREKAKNSWEITAVNEMLSQMERHTEPFILTTNLMNDLDAASLRRFTFKLEFKFLAAEQAKRLFVQYFGCEAPHAIERNDKLAPGDFANVKRQAMIRKVTDSERLYAMLKAETDLKDSSGVSSIGFHNA